MKTKTVKRYWCDFCNKAGMQAHSMAKHEKHCTLNPARSCRVCTLINGGYAVGAEKMVELLALLPDPTAFQKSEWNNCHCKECGTWPVRDVQCTNEFKKLNAALEDAMPKLRAATDNCPACILAALRQKKITVGMVPDFDFSAEMRTVFANNQEDEWPY